MRTLLRLVLMAVTLACASAKPVPTRSIGNQGRNVAILGNFARSHEPQLQFCYSEYGTSVNPSLAGKVTVAVTVTGSGQVTAAQIAGRSWSGKGVPAVESCIISRVTAWRFPASDASEGTYPLSFVFSR